MPLLIDLLQWPAMAATAIAAWAVGSTTPLRRRWGFWLFLLSNVLWVAWGIGARAWAVVVLQFVLAALNIRGARKAERVARHEQTGAVSRP